MSDDKPMPRRRFFREGLAELFAPLARRMEPLSRAAEEIGKLDQPVRVSLPVRHWLRPPGAQEEQRFRDVCTRSGDCVRVCPSHAIRIDYHGSEGEGVPYIDSNISACVLCTGLSCMHACPSGALQPNIVDYIDMGVAVWHEATCLKTSGQACQICVDICPVGVRAIAMDGDKITVREGCTGCGSCQHACPTQPKSITVLPKSAR